MLRYHPDAGFLSGGVSKPRNPVGLRPPGAPWLSAERWMTSNAGIISAELPTLQLRRTGPVRPYLSDAPRPYPSPFTSLSAASTTAESFSP